MKRLIFITLSFLSVSSIALPATPQVGTISPPSGDSDPNELVTFTTSYSDTNGYRDIKTAYLLVNTKTNGRNCLYAYYNQRTNRLYLRDDNNTTWQGGYNPGSANTITNSYAEIDCSQTSVSSSGNTLIITWAVTFKVTFKGAKNTYLKVIDRSNASSRWIQVGTWTINDDTPTDPTISIDQGDYTNSREINLSLSAGNAVEMIISEDSNFSDAPWETYATSKVFTLSDGDGGKTVYIKYKGTAGSETSPVSDTIILDTMPPEIEITSPRDGSTVIGY